jgi:CelD/BcsL family acetyltransferase involved in cellulose biosynthesis
VLAPLVLSDRRRVTLVETPCPTLRLPATWEEYESGLGRNLRQNLRRYARKLERDSGEALVTEIVTDPTRAAAAIDVVADLHQRVRSARGDAGVFRHRGMIEFHRLLARRLAEEGRLRLYALTVSGAPISAIYCMRFGDVVSFYQTGYDPAFAKYGPGRYIMAQAIRASIEEGAREFDFLRGDEAYKAVWGATVRCDLRIRVPRSLRGRVVAGLRRVAHPRTP